METTKEKTCENCRFYKQHYVKTSAGYLCTLYGHCSNDNVKFRNKTERRKNCEYWQTIEIQINNRKKELTDNIKILVKHLDAVCEVLLHDNG